MKTIELSQEQEQEQQQEQQQQQRWPFYDLRRAAGKNIMSFIKFQNMTIIQHKEKKQKLQHVSLMYCMCTIQDTWKVTWCRNELTVRREKLSYFGINLYSIYCILDRILQSFKVQTTMLDMIRFTSE